MFIASIDPGKNGAVTFWDDFDGVIDIVDIPYVGKKINFAELLEIIASSNPDVVIVEDVHTSPQMGVVSAGNFMYSLGCIHTAVTAVGSKLVKLTPKKWKTAMGLYKKTKVESVKTFQECFEEKDYIEYIKGHKNAIDRAESALIGQAYLKLEGVKK